MIVKAKKTAGGYLIPNMPVWQNKDVIYLKISTASEENMLSEEKDQNEEAKAKLGGNPFLELKLKHLPKDFEEYQTQKDKDYKELVGTAIMERYREKEARSEPVKPNLSPERLLFRKKYCCEDIFSIGDVLKRLENNPL